MINTKLQQQIMWMCIALLAVLNFILGSTGDGLLGPLTPFYTTIVLFVFACVHGIHKYGLKKFLIFFLITFVVSWTYETISILTGFPFGSYDYSAFLGQKIWLVPIQIMPSYFAMGYLTWTVAHVLLDKFDAKLKDSSVFTVPLIASFLMVMWDLSMDPHRATMLKAWTWENGGVFFGVPFSNFLGWFLCVFTIFQLFALYQRSQSEKFPEEATPIYEKNHWLQPTLMYGVIIVEFIATYIFNVSSSITTLDGHQWWTKDILGSLALVSIFTMFFVTVLSTVKILSNKNMTKN
ncbi:carotenoid biosynthesis protein [Thalassotalea piscium]